MAASIPKKAITTLKVLISGVLIYFIYTKINFQNLLEVLGNLNPAYLLWAILLFVISKFFAALRLHLYFQEIAIPLTHKSNFKLYLLGMFYNLFLPGGIGGDAYKGYLIKQKFGIKTKKVVSVLVLDRLSGLLLLFIYACGLGLFLGTDFIAGQEILLTLGIFISTAVFWLVNKKLFNYVLPVFWKSFGYSALVQFAQLACVWSILQALAIQIQTIAYLFLFLISSIVAVLPITIGGIGSREVTFLYGAQLLSLNEDTAVGVSMVFFLVTAVVSLLGIVYHVKKPSLETTNT